MILQSPPVWWSGLKGPLYYYAGRINQSPPVWWSGLKVFYLERRFSGGSLHLCGGVD